MGARKALAQADEIAFEVGEASLEDAGNERRSMR
jgi:hypothetical protein